MEISARELDALIENSVKNGVAVALSQIEIDHKCRFNLSEDEAKELMYHFSEVADSGDGSFMEGLQDMRENHRWMREQRTRAKKISSVFLYTFITAVATGFAYKILNMVGLLPNELK